MCKYCNTRLEGDKKDTLQKHVKSTNHIDKKKSTASTSGTKRQRSIASGFERQKRAKEENDTFVEDTVSMCLKANIPLHKFYHPAVREYIAKYVPGSGALPCADTLIRRKVVSKQQLKDKPIVIVADETSDGQGRCVFAILFRTIDSVLHQE
ncbi:CGG triplet repeat-binding protein 1-like [Diabrotica undecimpunctata]|uniref:CGG triplet repeat-binding protein 1-like n=1 Tax=Diabrotica undecimpunctata TaxID=50387 RepID=UPI003B63B1B1